MKFKVSVGQDVVLEPTGNFVRWHGSDKLHGVVEKIARTYFYVRCGSKMLTFSKGDCAYYDKEEANGGYELFPDEATYYREMERRSMTQKIRIRVRDGSLNDLGYEQVKQMYDILMGTEQTKP